MAATLAIETEHDRQEARRQQRAEAPQRLPQLHKLRHGDVAPVELEDLVGPLVVMEPNPPPVGAHREGDLGAVVELAVAGDERRIGHVPPSQTAERVAHEAAARLALGGRVQMLKLTPAAFVLHVVRTARRDPIRGWLEQPARSRLSEVEPSGMIVRIDPSTMTTAPAAIWSDSGAMPQ